MAKKKIKKLSFLSSTSKPRVRKSYYTFSRQYPAGNLHMKHMRSRSKRSPKMRLLLTALCFVLITVLSYFTVSLMLNISYKEPDNTVTETREVSEPFIKTDGVKALYMPYNKLGDEKYIKSFISLIRRKNANSVVIDFKTQQGKLAYTSLHEYAIAGKCALYDNDTVRRAIDIFEQYNINIIAGIYCFEDNAVSSAVKDISVKYMDTSVNWLDTDGNSWLNPCSKRSQNYIINVISEINEMGIKGFILKSTHFPDDKNNSGASYPGLAAYQNQNHALRYFITKVQMELPDDCFVLLSQGANDAITQNNTSYHGSMANSSVHGFAFNISERPETYIIDKKTDFSSILSLYSNLNAINAKKYFVPVIDMSEYSASLVRHAKKAGYTNFILYNENGEY